MKQKTTIGSIVFVVSVSLSRFVPLEKRRLDLSAKTPELAQPKIVVDCRVMVSLFLTGLICPHQSLHFHMFVELVCYGAAVVVCLGSGFSPSLRGVRFQ